MRQSREAGHVPVLLKQVIEAFTPQPGGRYIDGTVGAGGHAAEILRATSPDGLLLGLDCDPAALEAARKTLAPFGARAKLVKANLSEIGVVAVQEGFHSVDGVLLDLGLSSLQLADPERGFSFESRTLDMRMDPTRGETAGELVNEMDEAELADLIYRYGEEHRARRIARVIVENRPFASARELADVIAGAVGRRGRIHPATRTFMALRIAVNHELDNLAAALPQLETIVRVGGKAAIITFHSLEDRIVKRFFKEHPHWKNLTKHPLKPEFEEVQRNPRARSAKLRVALRV